ncbi:MULTISPECIES: DUF805 domain-containing protein [unclassified Novosphingobium]|uniref:DUF805 domain-containing protein n=1 Tax=unclassified Novosphingobium TaxID=2644732 RepID=UPI000EF0B7BB|nr:MULTISPECIES: DUF805 domain-containing protein [unclassified Novosphingobium]HCF24643.1 DUF805 domain-containing protein [Novosphingobium sp.]
MEWMLMPYRRYAEFHGRSRRMEYWMFTLFSLIVMAACATLMFAGGLTFSESGEPPEFGVLFWIGAVLFALFALGSMIPSIALTIRRFHDRDMSGWWYLGFIVLGFIPIVGNIASIVNLVIMALPGTQGANRFGDDPINPTSADIFS